MLYLDDTLTAVLATGFRNILHGDSLSAIVDAECEDSPEPEMCAQPMRPAPLDPGADLFNDFGSEGLLFRVERVSGMRSSGESLQASIGGGWPPSCLDIARELYHSRDRERGARLSVTGVLGSVFSNVLGVDLKGRLTVGLTANALAGVMAAEADHRAKVVELEMLGSLYSAYDCFSHAWEDAAAPHDPFGGSTGPGGEGGNQVIEIVCGDWYELRASEDGGVTWISTGVAWEACHYEVVE